MTTDTGSHRSTESPKLVEAATKLLAAAKRALNVFKGQGESVRPGNVLGALDDAIRNAEGR